MKKIYQISLFLSLIINFYSVHSMQKKTKLPNIIPSFRQNMFDRRMKQIKNRRKRFGKLKKIVRKKPKKRRRKKKSHKVDILDLEKLYLPRKQPPADRPKVLADSSYGKSAGTTFSKKHKNIRLISMYQKHNKKNFRLPDLSHYKK